MFLSSYLAALVQIVINFDVNVVGAVDDYEYLNIESRDESCVTDKKNQKDVLNTHQKIQYGFDADVKNHPSIVALFKNGWFTCGGVILSRTTVITASHCVISTAEYSIRAGNSYKDYGTLYQVKKKLMHPNYDFYSQDYDFALLFLSSDIEFNSKTRSVSLVNSAVPGDVEVEAYGWGNTEKGVLSESLKGIKIFTLSHSNCVKGLSYYTVTKRMLCAMDKSSLHKDTCVGDSGGPLYYKGLLAGLTSWGECEKNDPSVYSNVYEVRDWIKRNLI